MLENDNHRHDLVHSILILSQGYHTDNFGSHLREDPFPSGIF